jgi:predicted DNA-binding transcriptional regulator AlpA
MHPERLLKPEQAADQLQISPQTLARWRWSGDGPRFVKVGRCVRYRQVEIDRFIEAGQRKNTCKVEVRDSRRAVSILS